MTIDEIRDNFALLEEWDDRYRYVIELGRMLDPLPEAEHSRRQQGAGLRQPGLAVETDRSQQRASRGSIISATAMRISCAA